MQNHDEIDDQIKGQRYEVQFYRIMGAAFLSVAITIGGAVFGLLGASSLPFHVSPELRLAGVIVAAVGAALTLVFVLLGFRNIAREDRLHQRFMARLVAEPRPQSSSSSRSR